MIYIHLVCFLFWGYKYKSQTNLVMFKELEKEGGNSCSDANEEVDDNKEHIGCTGNLKPEGCWVHYGSDGPPRKKSTYPEQNHFEFKSSDCDCIQNHS